MEDQHQREEDTQQSETPSVHEFETEEELQYATNRVRDILREHKGKIILGFAVAWVAVEIATLPFSEISDLQRKNPPETALMRENAALRENRPPRLQRWVPLDQIPKDVVNAVVVAEDGTFWWHEGFDWFEFKESLERNIKEWRAVRGASTISQQLVKNLFLSSSKNPLRKVKEWILTWYLEKEINKSRILELYLNIIEWGEGVYGVEAAAEAYFGKPVTDLTREEAARLAAIIPSPRRHRADEETTYVTRRMNLILERMSARGM